MVDEAPSDGYLTAWLAEATGDDPAHVRAELELGERRRAFVACELIEAGFTGAPLREQLMRLTGVDEVQAHALIATHAPAAEPETADASQRDARLAQNEIRFRELNEQAAHLDPCEPAPDRIELVCECSDRECTRTFSMPFSEYEWLRQNSWRFAVLPGHEAPAVEDVVERNECYAIVEKHAETHHLVEVADPRSS
jgi:hypothetical protein